MSFPLKSAAVLRCFALFSAVFLNFRHRAGSNLEKQRKTADFSGKQRRKTA
jgi:hypothetical protein